MLHSAPQRHAAAPARCGSSSQARPCHAAAARRAAAPMRLHAASDPAARAADTAAAPDAHGSSSRRGLMGSLAAAAAVSGLLQQLLTAGPAAAISGSPLGFKKELARRRRKIPEDEFSDGPQGLKYYDLTVGAGAEAKVGQRVAVHVDVKWRGITFFTSRQGVGVTGGTPMGFDIGQPAGAAGSTLAGVDLGVRGMRVGGQRRLLVPPSLGYGDKGVGEIPPNSTLQVDVELLSIKTNAMGFRTKLVEG